MLLVCASIILPLSCVFLLFCRYAEQLKPAADLLKKHLLPIRGMLSLRLCSLIIFIVSPSIFFIDSLPSGINWDATVDYDGYSAFVVQKDASSLHSNSKSKSKSKTRTAAPDGPKWLPHTKFDGVGARMRSTDTVVPDDIHIHKTSDNLISINMASYEVIDDDDDLDSMYLSSPRVVKLN